MGRSSKSDRNHRHDSEKAATKRHSDDDYDGSRHRHRRDHKNRDVHVDDDCRYSYCDDEKEGSHRRSNIEKEKKLDQKRGDKKHRRDRPTSTGRSDRSSKKRESKKVSKQDGDDSSNNSDEKHVSKRRKRHHDDDDGRRKKGKKDLSQTRTRILVDKSKLFSLGEQRRGSPPDTILDPENDYFSQNQRFRLYLYRECGLTFDDLSSNDARFKFSDFVRQYNLGELEIGYYASVLPVEALEECPSTRHQWGLNITHQDSQQLQMLQAGIRKQTEYHTIDKNHQPTTDTSALNASTGRRISEGKSIRDRNSEEAVFDRKRTGQPMNRRLREHVQTTMEELTGGRKEGHERQIEKRQERAVKIHGASKYEQDMVELDDSTLYGGNADDDFRRLTAASKQRTAQREANKNDRIVSLQQKEQDKQNAMLQMLGLSHKIGQSKIEIQPRNDPPDNS